MNKFFFTNEDGNTLLKRFNTIFEDKSRQIKELEIIVGFLRLSGLYEIKDSIQNLDKIKILIGISLDRLTFNTYDKFYNKDIILNQFQNDELKDLESLPYEQKTERGINLLQKLLQDDKIELKIHASKKLHAKIYIFLENPSKHYDNSIDYHGKVITGSSNFSISGLKNNVEINVELRDDNHIKESHEIFEKLWKDGIEITKEDISDIEKRSYIPQLTPYELYMKFLMEYFKDRVNLESEMLPEGFKRLTYQTDAVTQAWEILQRHNGVFLSDVVGLGKTIIAVRIMQKFISSVKDESILIITPPAIKSSWERTIKAFNISRYHKIESSSSLNKVKDIERYGLVVVDESHQFKNFGTDRFKELEKISKAPTYKGKRKKIILLSATPLNNRPEDLANQIYLFQDKRASTIPSFMNLEKFFASIDKRYKKAMKTEDDIKAENILDEISTEVRENILKPIMVRRTRTNIWSIESYKKDLLSQNMEFPHVNDVEELPYKLNEKLSALFIDTILTLSDKFKIVDGEFEETTEDDRKNNKYVLKYYRYQAVKYLKPEKKLELKIKQGVQEGFYDKISDSLSELMKTLLIKRLESSFQAFKSSLKRMYIHLGEFIKMFKDDRIIIAPDLKPIEYIIDNRFDELLKKLEENPEKGNIFARDDFEDEYLEELEEDLKKIKKLWKKWENIKDDPKVDSFNKLLNTKLKKYKKIVIFTESTVTAEYLDSKIKRDDILVVTSKNREDVEEIILKNFDANYIKDPRDKKKKKGKKTKYSIDLEYNVIITTETLAEGINLHLSNVIVNYDIPWNSTRLIQRIGRINRIGSPHKEIFIYNYIPTDESENEIKLADKAFKKIQTFHNTLGSDSQIFSSKEEMKDVQIYEENSENGDDEIYYLEDLRIFKEKDRDSYNKLKKIPNKLRSIRKGDNDSYIYMKNGSFEQFYHIKTVVDTLKNQNNSKFHSISFLKMAKVLKADKEEKIYNEIIPKFHYDDVNKAKDEFNKELKNLKESTSKKIKVVKGKTDKSSIKSLKNLLTRGIKDYDKVIVENIIIILTRGVFKNLGKDINKITKIIKDKKKKKEEVLPSDITNIYKSLEELYIQYRIEENIKIKKEEIYIDIETILSETFIN